MYDFPPMVIGIVCCETEPSLNSAVETTLNLGLGFRAWMSETSRITKPLKAGELGSNRSGMTPVVNSDVAAYRRLPSSLTDIPCERKRRGVVSSAPMYVEAITLGFVVSLMSTACRLRVGDS